MPKLNDRQLSVLKTLFEITCKTRGKNRGAVKARLDATVCYDARTVFALQRRGLVAWSYDIHGSGHAVTPDGVRAIDDAKSKPKPKPNTVKTVTVKPGVKVVTTAYRVRNFRDGAGMPRCRLIVDGGDRDGEEIGTTRPGGASLVALNHVNAGPCEIRVLSMPGGEQRVVDVTPFATRYRLADRI